MKRNFLLIVLAIASTNGFSQTLFSPSGIVGTSSNSNVGIGTGSPEAKLHIQNGNFGIKSTLSDVAIESNDAQLDLISSSDATWGSALNFIEGNGGSNTDIWSIARQTTGGSGNSSLTFNFGTTNQHNNPTFMTLSNTGNIGIGTTSPESKLHVQNGNFGIRSVLGDVAIESNDAQLDLISGPDATWGSALNFIEGNGSSNTDIWSIARQTTGGSGNSSLTFNFGTTNQHNNPTLMTLSKDGKLGIGTTDFSGSHKLRVEGSIGAREIKVEASGWSDFVFYDNYELRTLEEVEQHINDNGHLPEIPSEAEVTENGINLGEMNAKLLQKIEELTLYLIEQNKALKNAQAEILELKEKVNSLENN